MSKKEMQAARRMLKTLARGCELIEKQDTAGCLTLQQTQEHILTSNARCVQIMQEQLRVAEKNQTQENER
jgi:hypothetical protein